mgnify:CR=1 FL=1
MTLPERPHVVKISLAGSHMMVIISCSSKDPHFMPPAHMMEVARATQVSSPTIHSAEARSPSGKHCVFRSFSLLPQFGCSDVTIARSYVISYSSSHYSVCFIKSWNSRYVRLHKVLSSVTAFALVSLVRLHRIALLLRVLCLWWAYVRQTRFRSKHYDGTPLITSQAFLPNCFSCAMSNAYQVGVHSVLFYEPVQCILSCFAARRDRLLACALSPPLLLPSDSP